MSFTRPSVVLRPIAVLSAVAAMLAACLPIPGGGWDEVGPAERPTVGSEGLLGAASDADQRCPDPRLSPLVLEAIPVARSADDRSGSPTPRLVRLDPARAFGFQLGSEVGGGCLQGAVLVGGSDSGLLTLAAAHAVIEGVPFVLLEGMGSDGRSDLVAQLEHLEGAGIRVYGPAPQWAATLGVGLHSSDGRGPDLLELTRELAAESGASIVLVAADDPSAQADVVAHAAQGVVPLVLPEAVEDAAALVRSVLAIEPALHVVWTASSTTHARALTDLWEVDELPRWAAPSGPGATAELWLGDVREVDVALLAAVTAAARGGAFVAVDGTDLRSGVERTTRVREGSIHPDGPVEVIFVGGLSDHTGWQLDTVISGTPLPGLGGFLPLEDRRIVAIYGSPDTPSLGLLGEQDDAATIARAVEFATRYEDAPDGRTAVAGLDVIATIASSAAESTGDYSRRVPIARLRQLVDLAGESGVAVFLDLQPGRTSFLVQAEEFEELLREPHVHLALDPEWRLGPGERHLVRIGSVPAEEVQEVADWLATLVRSERLPQKVLMLHQFTVAMLPDRDDIDVPPELIGVIHVDGQGPLPTKNRTYAALSGGAEERWSWGWKNFTRIDVPVATPIQSLDRFPIPVIVTYQ